MPPTGTINARFDRVKAAFAIDGFDVKNGYVQTGQRIGVAATHRTARNTVTGDAKKAFYLEGSNFEMGYLLGLLAEDDISRMATKYVDKVVFAFFDPASASKAGILQPLQDLIVKLILEESQKMRPAIPVEYVEELDGVLAGCKAAKPATLVTAERLWALNFGQDCVLAHVHSGQIFRDAKIHPGHLRMAIGCNGFVMSGAAAGGKVFFGRDFMFPTADVFQDTASLIIQNPDDREGIARRAFVSQTSPGIIGCMTGVNVDGVAIGVDMMTCRLANAAQPGFNSLSLNRHCMQYSATAEEAVRHITEAERGTPWLYPVADASGKAFVVEAGRRLAAGERFPYFKEVPRYYRRRLPRRRYIERMRGKYGTPAPERGLLARPAGYRYPEDYLNDWNRKLWNAFNGNWIAKILDIVFGFIGLVSDLFSGKPNLWPVLKKDIADMVNGAEYPPNGFGERDYINKSWTDKNCPGTFYFAPQREGREDTVVVSNHCISPEMRLTSMNEWTALVAKALTNDIQWRYDELNREVLDAIGRAAPGGVDRSTAWNLINFLRSNGQFGDYYNNGVPKLPWQKVQVHGSVNLCELGSRVLTSLYGYYGDEPITIRLMNY